MNQELVQDQEREFSDDLYDEQDFEEEYGYGDANRPSIVSSASRDLIYKDQGKSKFRIFNP